MRTGSFFPPSRDGLAMIRFGTAVASEATPVETGEGAPPFSADRTLSYLVGNALATNPNFASNAEAWFNAQGDSFGIRLENLTSEESNYLRSLSGSGLNSLRYLVREENPLLLAQGLLHLAQQASRAGKYDWASYLFNFLLDTPEALGAWVPESIRNQARTEYANLRGDGSWGSRIEFYSRHLFETTFDPGMIVGMGVAGILAGGIRLRYLNFLRGRPAAWWTRNLVAHTSASAIAFPFEVAGFWGANRVVNQIIHPEQQRWDYRSIRDELFGLTLTLGALKVGGGLVNRSFDRIHGIRPFALAEVSPSLRLHRTLVHQAGMYLGITGGHLLETAFGLREPTSPDMFFLDSFATLLQFNLGDLAARRILGRGHAARMNEVLRLTTEAEQNLTGPGDGIFQALHSFFNPRWHMVTTEGMELLDPFSEPLQMTAHDPTAPGSRPPGSALAEGDPVSLRTTLEDLVSAYRANNFEQRSMRVRYGRKLYEHRAEVEEILNEHQRREIEAALAEVERSRPERLGDTRYNHQEALRKAEAQVVEEIQRVKFAIRGDHLRSINEQFRRWFSVFNHIRDGLEQRISTGPIEEREATDRLLLSVETKLLETGRYYQNAESWLADEKGVSNSSPFSERNYSNIVRDFEEHLERFDAYLEKYPEFKEMAESLPGVGRRLTAEVSLENVLSEMDQFEQSGQSPEGLPLIREMLLDLNIRSTSDELVSLRYLFSRLNSEGTPDQFFEVYRPLKEFLETLQEVSAHVPIEELHRRSVLPWQAIASQSSDSEAHGYAGFQGLLIRALGEDFGLGLTENYMERMETLAQLLASSRPPSYPVLRFSYEEIKQQLVRRNIFRPEITQRIFDWCEATEKGSENLILKTMRDNALAGMLDFIPKDTHSAEERAQLVRFIEEVVERDDHGMMEMLFIRFQNYRMGQMRDRIQIRKAPSADESSDEIRLERFDRFLAGLLRTATFYHDHSRVRGPFISIFEKLMAERAPKPSKRDHAFELALPVIYQAREMLELTPEVQLIGRLGMGEGLLKAKMADGSVVYTGVTSVQERVNSRGMFYHFLEKGVAEASFASPSDPNAPVTRRIAIYVPRVLSGVAKEDLGQWARDFLEMDAHKEIDSIQLYIPASRTEVVDIGNPEAFRLRSVTRSHPTTESMIEYRDREVATGGKPRVDFLLELYRLRRGWNSDLPLQRGVNNENLLGPDDRELLETSRIANWELLKRMGTLFPRHNTVRSELSSALIEFYRDLRRFDHAFIPQEEQSIEGLEPVSRPFGRQSVPPPPSLRHMTPERLQVERVVDFLNTALGVSLSVSRYQRLLDLSPSHFLVPRINFDYGPKGLTLRGDVYSPDVLREMQGRSGEQRVTPVGDGHFMFRYEPDRRGGGLQAYLDNIILPEPVRGRGAGAILFSEIARFTRDLGAKSIVSDEANGMHVIWGFGPRDAYELTKLKVQLEVYAEGLIRQQGWLGYDLSPLRHIENAQQVAYAYLDPESMTVQFPHDVTQIDRGNLLAGLNPELQIGRMFFRENPDFTWKGEFDPTSGSQSDRILGNYLQHLFSRHYASYFRNGHGHED